MMNFRNLTTAQYNDFAFAYIKQFEGVKPEAYVGGDLIPTIGIGFNLRAHMEPVLQELGIDTSTADGQALLASMQYEVNKTWAQGGDVHSALTDVYQISPLTDPNATFTLSNAQMENLFNDLRGDFEAAVTGAMPVAVPESYERAVFLSLRYNNIIAGQESYTDASGNVDYTDWKIPSLRDDDAMRNDNPVLARAATWFEVGYNSGPLAQRRITDGETVRLYENTQGAQSLNEAADIARFIYNKSGFDFSGSNTDVFSKISRFNSTNYRMADASIDAINTALGYDVQTNPLYRAIVPIWTMANVTNSLQGLGADVATDGSDWSADKLKDYVNWQLALQMDDHFEELISATADEGVAASIDWTVIDLFKSDADLDVDVVVADNTIDDDIDGDTLVQIYPDNNTIFLGSEDNDTITTGNEDTKNVVLGMEGADIIIGGDGVDLIDAGADDDVVYGGGGSDVMSGGVDTDTLTYERYGAGVQVELLTAATPDTAAVYSAAPKGDPEEWQDRFMDFENLVLTRFDDSVLFDESFFELNIDGNGGIDAGVGFEQGDLLDTSTLDSGIAVVLQGEAAEPGVGFTTSSEEPEYLPGQIVSDGEALSIANFDNVVGTQYADSVVGSDGRNTIYGGDDVDTIDGGDGHDDLHGGLGDDIIDGGDGADWIYDRGADVPFADDQTLDEYAAQTLVYDGTGNDTIHAGAGSDVLIYSGGTDVFYGEEGDDYYLATGGIGETSGNTDNLTIKFSEDTSDPDNLSLIGHDLIAGDGRFVDEVVFEGLSRSDISVSYEFEQVYLGSEVVDFDPIFVSWFLDQDPATLDHYATIGSYQITILETGSTLTIENVVGFFSGGSAQGSLASVEASISVPFTMRFDDGLLDWSGSILDPATNHYGFKNTPLSDDAFNARDALIQERAVLDDETEGGEDDDDLFGDNGANGLNGSDGDDRLFGGGGADLLIGGAGGDVLNGGSGVDTASYETSTGRVHLQIGRFANIRYGDAQGDTFVSIENFKGSNFNDDFSISYDLGANVFWGLDGDDRINSLGGGDTLYGGDGNDILIVGEGTNELYGEAGNDTLLGGNGDDYLSGGEGDDALEVYNEGADGVGKDVLDGGNGIDTAKFLSVGTSVRDVFVDLYAGKAMYTTTDTKSEIQILNIENIETGFGHDIIYGDDGANVIDSGRGDDRIYGGGGDDIIVADKGHDVVSGGTGIDRITINAARSDVSFEAIDGGIKATIGTAGDNTVIIYDDVEFLEFNDVTLTYAEVAAPLQTEFDVVEDFIRINEGGPTNIDLLGNDLEFNANPLTLLKVNGTSLAVGDSLALEAGVVLTLLADGNLSVNQRGAYLGLDEGETASQTLTYTATDISGVEKTADVTLVFDGVASNPDAMHLENDVVMVTTNSDKAEMIRVGNFNIARSVVVVDNIFIDPNDLPQGVTIEEINGDTFVKYGPDDAIILEGVSFDTWKLIAAQRVAGSAGDDTINGTAASEFLDGGDGNDSITSGGGDDVIMGGSGDDVISLGDGSYTIFGGAGDDEIGTGRIGSAYADSGRGDDVIFGNAGDDMIVGGSGDDELHGDEGNDTLYGGSGDDILRGGAGDDLLYGGTGVDLFDGGEGNDTIRLDFSSTQSAPGAIVDLNNQTLNWKSVFPQETLISIENVTGTSNDDTLIGNEEANILQGLTGNDVIYGNGGDDTLYANGTGTNMVYGGTGDDFMWSQGTGDDTLHGNEGDDTFRGYRGNNTYDGGEGIDLLDLSNTSWDINVDLASGVFGTGGNQSTLTNIENVKGTSGDNQITGNAAANTLEGRHGDDTLRGLGGDDLLIGGAGSDTFVFASGDGHDTVVDFVASEDTIDISIDQIPDFEFLQVGADVVVNYNNGEDSILFQNAVLSEIQGAFPSHNIIHGTDANKESFYGTDADDIIYGHGGKDLFYAGQNLGADIYIGGEGVNHVWYTGSDTGVTLDLENNIGHGGAAEGDRWFDMQSIQASTHDDIVYGSSAADTVWLHQGNDHFYGQTGDDVIRLTFGTDYVDGGEGYDAVSFKQGNGHTIDVFAVGDARKTADMNTYVSIEEISAHKKDDVINVGSGAGVEVLNANKGDDILNIMANSGVFSGGQGADEFHFHPDNLLTSQTDITVSDFNAAEDTLTILGNALDLSGPQSLPAGFAYASTSEGDLAIAFGDDDRIVFEGVDALSFI